MSFAYFKFTPSISGTYQLQTTSSIQEIDTYQIIDMIEFNQIIYNYDPNATIFSSDLVLNEGVTYYFQVASDGMTMFDFGIYQLD